MKQISSFTKPLLKEVLSISLLPLITFAICSFFVEVLRNLQNQQNPTSPIVLTLQNVKEFSLIPYQTLPNFILTMMILHLILKLTSLFLWPPKSAQYPKAFLQFICYVLLSSFIIYCFSESKASTLNSIPSSSNNLELPQYRALSLSSEEREIPIPLNFEPSERLLLPKTSSFADVLASFDIIVYSLAYSPKNKLLFANLKNSSLQVYNVSNPAKPIFIKSIKTFVGYLLISPDENTIFEYDGLKLGIYENILHNNFSRKSLELNTVYTQEYSQRMAISSDGRILFLGGYTLQVYNVSGLQTLYTSKSLKKDFITALTLSKDQQTLFCTTAQGYLRTFDVSNPRNPIELPKIQFQGIPGSIELFNSKPWALVATYKLKAKEKKHELYVEQVDLSNITKPQLVSSHFVKDCQEFYVIYQSSENFVNCIYPKAKLYQEKYSKIMYYDQDDLRIIDISKKNVTNPAIIIPKEIEQLRSVVLEPNSDIVFLGAYGLLVSKLSFDVVPSQQLPLALNILSSSFLKLRAFETVFTSDYRYAFVLSGNPIDSQGAFQPFFATYNLTNRTSMTLSGLLSLPNTVRFSSTFSLSPDNKRALVSTNESMLVIDVTNPLNAEHITAIPFKDTPVACIFSLDGKLAYIILSNRNQTSDDLDIATLSLVVVNLSNLQSHVLPQENQDYFIFELGEFDYLQCISHDDAIELSPDGKTLFFMYDHLYTIPLPTWQELIQGEASPYLVLNATFDMTDCPSFKFAPDNQILFVFESETDPPFQGLKVFNLSSGTTLSSFTLAFTDRGLFCKGSMQIFLKSNVLAVVLYGNPSHKILFLDFSNLHALTVVGSHIGGLGNGARGTFFLLHDYADNSAVFISDSMEVTFFTLDQQYALSIPSKSFKLGETYSEEIKFLVRNDHATYNPVNVPYKFIWLSICNMKPSPLYTTPEMTFAQLPSWMRFDRDNGVLSVEPKSENDIKPYKICSAISNKILPSDFDSIPNKNISSSDLLAYLVSLGYVDPDFFLTPSFDPYDFLVVDSKYKSIEESVSEILLTKYVLIGMLLNVEASLSVKIDAQPIQINTPSRNTLDVIIQLDPTVHAQFVKKDYPNVLESITHNKTQIALEGSALYVNHALEKLLVDFEDGVNSCRGSISINDGLNPIVTQEIPNIALLLEKNSPPLLNPNLTLSIQGQVANVIAYTGQYMIIPLDHQAFIPLHEEEFTYELIMQDGSRLPEWISLRDLNIIVNPPEKLLLMNIQLGIVAKNEFKSVTDKFTLKVYPSLVTLFKVLGAYCGTLISLIGLRMYYPRIYNVICKKRYRHAQEFVLRPGDNVATTGPYPIAFIAEEIIESKILFGLLKSSVARELNQGSISSQNLVQHFIDPVSRELDKSKVKETLDRIPLSKEQINKLKHFTDPEAIKKNMVYQLIFNQLTSDQIMMLPAEKETQKVFNKIKEHVLDLVEWKADDSFKINEKKLHQQHSDISLNSVNESAETGLLIDQESPNLNHKLLKEALWVHAFNLSNIGATVENVSIQSKKKIPTRSIYGCIMRFLKKDLHSVLSASGKRLGYGLKHKIENGTLRFYGVVENEIRGQTLVIEIANFRGRILKEIWIHGESKVSHRNQRDLTNDIL